LERLDILVLVAKTPRAKPQPEEPEATSTKASPSCHLLNPSPESASSSSKPTHIASSAKMGSLLEVITTKITTFFD